MGKENGYKNFDFSTDIFSLVGCMGLVEFYRITVGEWEELGQLTISHPFANIRRWSMKSESCMGWKDLTCILFFDFFERS